LYIFDAAANSIVPALSTDMVAGFYVAKPPVTKISAINLI
jgi:hypothetical protein